MLAGALSAATREDERFFAAFRLPNLRERREIAVNETQKLVAAKLTPGLPRAKAAPHLEDGRTRRVARIVREPVAERGRLVDQAGLFTRNSAENVSLATAATVTNESPRPGMLRTSRDGGPTVDAANPTSLPATLSGRIQSRLQLAVRASSASTYPSRPRPYN